jgi:nicotinamidase-related amidase
VRAGEFTEEWVLSEARRQYDEGRADIGVDPGRTALLVVDMIDEFVKPQWCPYWVPEATRQVPAIRRLIDVFHEASLPIVYTAYELGLGGLNAPAADSLIPGGERAKQFAGQILQRVSIYEAIAPAPQDIVVLKHVYGGFTGTELDLVLKSLGVTTVVICGTMSNFCCGATAREAFWHGYRVIFGSDVTSTTDPKLHEAELRTLRRGFARVMTADEIADSVRGAAPALADGTRGP